MNPAVGLCSNCQHCRIVKSERSAFYLCRLSLTNPEYRKYPQLPVLRCRGYVPALSEEDGRAGASDARSPDDKLTG